MSALSQHLPSYLGFSYLGCGVSLHGCSSKAQPLLLTLDEEYLLMAAPPDLERGVAPLSLPAPAQQLLLGGGESLSCVQFFSTPWTPAYQASLSFTISRSLLKLRSIKLVMPCNHLILCHPLLLLPSIFPSIKVFSNESVLCIRWPKYWNFSISPFSEYSGLISFLIDSFDLLEVQGTLKDLFQHHSSKASILQCSAFFVVQLTSIHD